MGYRDGASINEETPQQWCCPWVLVLRCLEDTFCGLGLEISGLGPGLASVCNAVCELCDMTLLTD